MINPIATVAVILLMAGSAAAQEKQPRPASQTSTVSRKSGTISDVDAARSNPSAANTHDGTNGVSTGSSVKAGTSTGMKHRHKSTKKTQKKVTANR